MLSRLLKRPLRILAIETSFDDTGVCILQWHDAHDKQSKTPLRECTQVLHEQVYSQHELHASFGGVVPKLAQHAHRNIMPHAIKIALENSKLRLSDIDLFAVTQGPGTYSSLAVGIDTARLLASICSKPLYPIHHMVQFFKGS